MIRVFCDACEKEILEEAEGEGCSWNELLIRDENERVIFHVEHLCRKCSGELEKVFDKHIKLIKLSLKDKIS